MTGKLNSVTTFMLLGMNPEQFRHRTIRRILTEANRKVVELKNKGKHMKKSDEQLERVSEFLVEIGKYIENETDTFDQIRIRRKNRIMEAYRHDLVMQGYDEIQSKKYNRDMQLQVWKQLSGKFYSIQRQMRIRNERGVTWIKQPLLITPWE